MRNKIEKTAALYLSFWNVFRLLFVCFSLFLIGDVFYRWDGFSYHSTFLDFLPNVALVTILWTIVAAICALLIWLFISIFKWSCSIVGWKIRIEHTLMMIIVFVLLGITALSIKRSMWQLTYTSPVLKQLVFFSILFITIFCAWLLRNIVVFKKSNSWMETIHERIRPLVWLFGICFLISIPLVVFTQFHDQEKYISVNEVDESGKSEKGPNIILVTFDALTSRNMSLYGYKRPTTPFIDKWAAKGTVFTRLQAASNWTTSTSASLMTGKRVWSHLAYHPEGFKPIKTDIENLPLVLQRNGYYTMAFIQNPKASPGLLGLSKNFDVAPASNTFITPASMFGWLDQLLYQFFAERFQLYNWLTKEDFILRRIVNYASGKFLSVIVSPEKVFNTFEAVLSGSHPKPYFAWIHLDPPHHPYLPPDPYMGMFDSAPELRTMKDQEVLLNKQKKYLYKQEHFSDELTPLVQIYRARYDEFIRYCDQQFNDFIVKLQSKNKLDNTVVILSADHGESFSHNFLIHGDRFLYEDLTHIPLVIMEPDQTEGQTINDLVGQIDIPTTILDIADIPIPEWMEGHSLLPLMRGEESQPWNVFSMNFQNNPGRGSRITKGTIAVWEGDYKLIHYLDAGKSQLFNLKNDPGEIEDLFDSEPELGQRLFSIIEENLEKANERIRKQ